MPVLFVTDHRSSTQPHPSLERALRGLVALGITLVLLLPLARGHNPWLGWAPLWLVGMPLSAWWALHRFRLPALSGGHRNVASQRRRWRRPQARRRVPQAGRAAARELSRMA